MAMVVKNNMSAVRTLNTLNKNSSALQKSLAKVSSGMKINSAQDDASGYAISERMRVQIRSLDQANQNTQNASSLMKTAEGAVSSTMEILKSLKEKAINAATDTNTDQDRATIQKELDQFIDQIDDNALTTFNGKYLVDGSKAQRGTDTATTMTNQSLGLYEVDGETELTSGTALTNLTNRNGESLEIRTTDSVTASFVMNGKTYTTTYKVEGTTLGDIFTNLNAVYASDTGVEGAAAFGTGAASASSGSSVAGATPVKPTEPTVPKPASEPTAPTTAAITAAVGSLTGTIGTGGGNGAAVTGAQAILNAYFGNLAAGKAASQDDMKATSEYTSASAAAQNYANSIYTGTPGTGTPHVTATNAGGVKTAIDNYNTAVSGYTSQKADWDAWTKYEADLAAYNAAVSGGGGSSSSASTDGDLVIRSDKVGVNAYGDDVYTANGETGLTVTAATPGIQTQISGLTISITDSEGNVKKAANASLDAFKTTIYAKNHSEPNELTFQVGAAANQAITVGLEDMRSEALGLKGSDGSKISLATQEKANAAVAVFDNAIQKVLDHQATIGAIEARLEYTSQNLTTSSENVQAAESTIRDADMAKEMTDYTKNNVLLQAAQSMLAQANQNSSAVLSLLQ